MADNANPDHTDSDDDDRQRRQPAQPLMIRAATPGDLTRLLELVRELHERSIFPERKVALSETLARQRLFEGVRRHGGEHAGSTLLNVVEFRGRVEAFFYGLLQPIYSLCVGLEAQDFLLYASPKAPKLSSALLIDAYLEWALPNERVRDIYLSWTGAAGVDGTKLVKLYERKGFQRFGEIWKRGAR